MPYSLRQEMNHGGRHQVAIFNKDKHRVVAHVEADDRAGAIKKAKKVARLREMFSSMHGYRSRLAAADELRDLPDPSEIETRAAVGSIEVRDRDGKQVIVGHIPYDVLSHPLGERGEFREILKPGVFAHHLAQNPKPDVIAKWDHGKRGMGLPLGRSTNNTLRCEERADGLHYEVEPPDTQEGRDVLTSVKRGDVTGTSFGFRPVKEKWTRGADGGHLRELHEAQLTDVSPTPDPAYPQTNLKVALRGLREIDPTAYRSLMEEQEGQANEGDFVRWLHPEGERSANLKVGKSLQVWREGTAEIRGCGQTMAATRDNPVHLVCEYRDDEGDGVHEPAESLHLVQERDLQPLDTMPPISDEEMLQLLELAEQHELTEINDRLRLLERGGALIDVGADLDGEPSYS